MAGRLHEGFAGGGIVSIAEDFQQGVFGLDHPGFELLSELVLHGLMLGFANEIGEGGVVVAVVVEFFGEAMVKQVEAGGDVWVVGGEGFHAAVGDGALGGGLHDALAV